MTLSGLIQKKKRSEISKIFFTFQHSKLKIQLKKYLKEYIESPFLNCYNYHPLSDCFCSLPF